MIIANQELAVHLKLIRNLTGMTSGRFYLRIALNDARNPKVIATPLNLIEKESARQENRSEFDDNYYTSRMFYLKAGMNVNKQRPRFNSTRSAFSK